MSNPVLTHTTRSAIKILGSVQQARQILKMIPVADIEDINKGSVDDNILKSIRELNEAVKNLEKWIMF